MLPQNVPQTYCIITPVHSQAYYGVAHKSSSRVVGYPHNSDATIAKVGIFCLGGWYGNS